MTLGFIPNPPAVIPNAAAVIPNAAAVIPNPPTVIPSGARNLRCSLRWPAHYYDEPSGEQAS